MREPRRRSPTAKPTIPMSATGVEWSARFKETFYHYDNRRSADNRGHQTHLGPSEIGSPCDRRLAMSLMRHPPVVYAGLGWAPFVGTCGHKGVGDMFLWANNDSGRYLVETVVTFPSSLMPRGTLDLYDRLTRTVVDFKFQGRYALNKLRTEGPGPTYRVQLQTYGWGLAMMGEDVERVALIALPRESSNLDDMYVWDESYDPQVARDALARVQRISDEVRDVKPISAFTVGDDCKWCPFHKKGARSLEEGCSGKQ